MVLDALEVNTQDFVSQTGCARSTLLDNLIKEAQKVASREYSLSNLKRLYQNEIRPQLASRALLHRYPLKHQNTEWLRYQTHVLLKKTAKFTSAYDVANHMVGLPKYNWVFFMNFLAQERIDVVEMWESIATIENLVYHHGLNDFSNIHFFKGEADARYNEESKTADLSIMIWKNDQVVHSETFLDVPYCFSTIQSEAKAAFAILVEAKKHGIENLLLWVDNKRVAEVILGKWQIDIGDRNRKLFMALRSLRRSFKRLIVTCVPRELLQITDGMLRERTVLDAKAAGVKLATFVKSANRWTYHLNAMPLFDISMTPETVDTIKKFGKPKDGEPQSNKWYIEVPEGSKVSALQNIMETLSPSQLYVAVQHVENKQRLLQELYTLIGNVVPVKINSWSVFLADSIGSDITGKRVMVVFDGFYLEKELERASDFIITLSKPEERRQLSAAGFQELSASCYIYYHGACSPTM